MNDLEEAPFEVIAENGTVFLRLPDERTVDLSVQAAEALSHRLLHAAFEANGQRLLKDRLQ